MRSRLQLQVYRPLNIPVAGPNSARRGLPQDIVRGWMVLDENEHSFYSFPVTGVCLARPIRCLGKTTPGRGQWP